ncbi:MAG: calcium-binding protein [Cyanobacteria bacterium P01_F01_bin.4]
MSIIPFSDEKPVNTVTDGDQRDLDIGMDDIGNHVIVYESIGQDGSGSGIFARRFDDFGNALAPEFQVNLTTEEDQSNPAVAMSGQRFAIVWDDETDHPHPNNPDDEDASKQGVFGSLYNADGEVVVSEFRVNTTVKNAQHNPEIAMAQNGDFVVVWQSQDQAQFLSRSDIVAQRFDSNGNPIGEEILVNQDAIDGDQENIAVDMADNGDFVVVWESNNGGNIDIFARQFSAGDGGTIIPVNSATEGVQRKPKVAIRPDGAEFVVTWDSNAPGLEDDGLYARKFGRDGQPTSEEKRIETKTKLGISRNHSVDMEAGGDFVITWQGDAGSDDPSFGIYAQYFEATGQPLGDELHINNVTASTQDNPVVALTNDIANPRRPFVVAWETDEPGEANGIASRMFGQASVVEFAEATFEVQEPESDEVPVNITLKRAGKDFDSGDITITLTEDSATADDFQTDPDTFPTFTTSFGADEDTATLELLVKADDLEEGIEKVSFEITDAGINTLGEQKTTTLQILDADSENIPDPDDDNGGNSEPDPNNNTATDQDDVLTGTDADDTLSGLGGNDTLFGSGGNDTLRGGDDNDLILGEDGDDRLFGDEGNDDLLGGQGKDELFGLAGADSLGGQEGDDLLDGGTGDDILIGEEGNDTLLGGKQNDHLTGGTGDDRLFGEEGDDILIGVGAEAVFPSPTLGLGEKDLLNGGSGGDTFVLGDANQVFYDDGLISGDHAIIEDFATSEDIIRLHGSSSDYALSLGSLEGTAGTFIQMNDAGADAIAFVQGASNLSLEATYFQYV